MSCFQKAAFSKRRVKKGTACREGMVSQGADMKVYLEGSEQHHETGGVLHQKNTVNLFTHTVVVFILYIYYQALPLCWP